MYIYTYIHIYICLFTSIYIHIQPDGGPGGRQPGSPVDPAWPWPGYKVRDIDILKVSLFLSLVCKMTIKLTFEKLWV